MERRLVGRIPCYLLVILLVTGLATACGKGEPPLQKGEPPLQFSPVRDGNGTWLYAYEQIIQKPSLFVFTKREEIVPTAETVIYPESLQNGQGGRLVDNLQSLNYDQTFAVLAMLSNSGAYTLNIDRVVRSGQTITLHGTITAPRPGEVSQGALRAPYTTIAITKDGNDPWVGTMTFQLVVDGQTLVTKTHDF